MAAFNLTTNIEQSNLNLAVNDTPMEEEEIVHNLLRIFSDDATDDEKIMHFESLIDFVREEGIIRPLAKDLSNGDKIMVTKNREEEMRREKDERDKDIKNASEGEEKAGEKKIMEENKEINQKKDQQNMNVAVDQKKIEQYIRQLLCTSSTIDQQTEAFEALFEYAYYAGVISLMNEYNSS